MHECIIARDYQCVVNIEVIKKLETARTPANLAATDAGTRWT